jgi:hypothetical protein
MNIKLKRGIFRHDIRAIGAFNLMGINSNVGSINNNICFDTNFYSLQRAAHQPGISGSTTPAPEVGCRHNPVDIKSELEKHA